METQCYSNAVTNQTVGYYSLAAGPLCSMDTTLNVFQELYLFREIHDETTFANIKVQISCPIMYVP